MTDDRVHSSLPRDTLICRDACYGTVLAYRCISQYSLISVWAVLACEHITETHCESTGTYVHAHIGT